LRWVLVGLAALLAAVVGLEWLDWPPTPPQGAAPPPTSSGTPAGAKTAKPGEGVPPLEDKDQYAVVMERPLFLPDRRPPPEEPEEPEAKKPEIDPDLSKVSLTAVLLTPKDTSAWVEDPEEKVLVRLHLGDELHGWTVKEILGDRLVLVRQGDTDTLVLRDYKNRPQPGRNLPARPRRPPQRTSRPHRPGAARPRTRAHGARFLE
jgi:general secretion pathway protein N